MFNKRGQEGITLGTLLLIILGVVVVVVIIMGATGGLNFIFDKVEVVPGQSLETKVQACIVAANAGLKADMCNTFHEVEINGKEKYVNCADTAIEKLVSGSEGVTGTIGCTDNEANVKEFCQSLADDNEVKDDTMVNDQKCKELLADKTEENTDSDNEVAP